MYVCYYEYFFLECKLLLCHTCHTELQMDCKWLRVCFHVFSPPTIQLQLIPSNLGYSVSPFSSHTPDLQFQVKRVNVTWNKSEYLCTCTTSFWDWHLWVGLCPDIMEKVETQAPLFCSTPPQKISIWARIVQKNGEWEIMERHPTGE